MPRFVVLIHDHPQLHWDFLLEFDGQLRAWRLDKPPDAEGEISALPLADHLLHYLDYEGPVSGNRGDVRRCDRGEYELIENTPERLAVRLRGSKLAGIVTLIFDATDQVARFDFLPE